MSEPGSIQAWAPVCAKHPGVCETVKTEGGATVCWKCWREAQLDEAKRKAAPAKKR